MLYCNMIFEHTVVNRKNFSLSKYGFVIMGKRDTRINWPTVLEQEVRERELSQDCPVRKDYISACSLSMLIK